MSPIGFEPVSANLTLSLLGPYQACIGDHPLRTRHSRKEQCLLALLALRHNQVIERSWLAETLWPESSGGLALLRDTLSDLRLSLGPYAGRLSAPTPRTVSLHLQAGEADILNFDTAILKGDRKSLEMAVALYRGPLLEGWTDEWCAIERESREQCYLKAREQLAEYAREAGDFAEAAKHLRQIIVVNPLQESAYSALMQVLAAQQNYADVTRVYRDLRLLLHREINAEVSEPTHALYRQIQTEARSPTPVQSKAQAHELNGPSLPATHTTFFGRAEEIAGLVNLLGNNSDVSDARVRLITLTGMAGIGKTRLALEAAHELALSFQHGPWLVPLADLDDPVLIGDAILNSLGITRSQQQEPIESIAAALAKHPSLLILDNFEHLVDEGAAYVARLLARIPKLRILVTSRQLLGLNGEHSRVVSPLLIPKDGETGECLRLNDSIRLFESRAREGMPHFQITDSNLPAISELCRRLEGIPLALELAAARSVVLVPDQMLKQLEQRFSFLVGRKRDAPGRHRSLHACLEWTYQMLGPDLQRFFARLAVFRGSWTAEAAAAVCEEPQTLDYLAQLRECSFVLAEERSGEMRFRMLETIREFGEQKLCEAEELLRTRNSHFAWFLSLAEQAEKWFTGPEQVLWFERIELDHHNFRVALAWSEKGQPHLAADAGLRMAGALFRFWMVRGYFVEGRSHLTNALERSERGVPGESRAKALNGLAAFTAMQGDMAAAKVLFQECLDIRKKIGDKILIANTLNNLGLVEPVDDQHGCSSASALYQESLSIYTELGDRQGMAYSFSRLAGIAYMKNDYDEARSLYSQGLTLRRQCGDLHGVAMSLAALGNIARDTGCYLEAKTLSEESLEIKQELGDRWGIAESLNTLGVVARSAGDYAAAQRLHEESLRIFQELADKGCIANTLTFLGQVAFCTGDNAAALRLYAEGLSLRLEHGYKIIVAESLEAIAEALLSQGSVIWAAQILGAADYTRQCTNSGIRPAQCENHVRLVTQLRSLLGEAHFNTAWNEGRAISMETAMAYALKPNTEVCHVKAPAG